MFDLFGLSGLGNYEARKVARYPEDGDDFLVDTAAVYDSQQPYETAVKHPRYNDGKMVIVQMYVTKEEAVKGHAEWVAKMTSDVLPETLKDVSTCNLVGLGLLLGADIREEHPIK